MNFLTYFRIINEENYVEMIIKNWVTDNLLTDRIQLPECQPEHLIAAVNIKHVFTGQLNACIDSCPPFPGKERHLLRAQLARITHST